MVDLRKIVVVFLIAVLFAIFVFSMIDAVYPPPEYGDFCDRAVKPVLQRSANCTDVIVPDEFYEDCNNRGGIVRTDRDAQGCVESYECDMCSKLYNDARDEYEMYVFIISAILGLIAIVAALYLPTTNDMNEWVGTGFMLGGLFSLFFGTARYFDAMPRFVRPIVILAELIIVIYLAYRKLSTKKNKRR